MLSYLLLLFSYLVGSIPCGLLLGKVAGTDIRKSGSGNIGATNVNRLLGKKLGVLTLAGDVGKGLLPMALTGWLLTGNDSRQLWILLSGFFAFLGHLYPVYLRFKGGKGVATALGVVLYCVPPAVPAALVVFALAVFLTGYVSVGSLAASALTPCFVWFLSGSLEKTVLAVCIAFFIWLRHRENIVRLIHHEEKSWKKAPKE